MTTLPPRAEVDSAIEALRAAGVDWIHGMPRDLLAEVAADPGGPDGSPLAGWFARAALLLAAESIRDAGRIAALPDSEVTLASDGRALSAQAGGLCGEGLTIFEALSDLEVALAEEEERADECRVCRGSGDGDPDRSCPECGGTGRARRGAR